MLIIKHIIFFQTWEKNMYIPSLKNCAAITSFNNILFILKLVIKSMKQICFFNYNFDFHTF